MTQARPVSIHDWQELVPPFEVVPNRFLVLERGLVGAKCWWRIVIIDNGPDHNAVRTGLPIWEREVDNMTETGVKEFFTRFATACKQVRRETNHAFRQVMWEALKEVDRNRVTQAELNLNLPSQLELLEQLAVCEPHCHETAVRLLVKLPEALGTRRLAKAVEVACEFVRD